MQNALTVEQQQLHGRSVLAWNQKNRSPGERRDFFRLSAYDRPIQSISS
jgi:hypothetical protein